MSLDPLTLVIVCREQWEPVTYECFLHSEDLSIYGRLRPFLPKSLLFEISLCTKNEIPPPPPFLKTSIECECCMRCAFFSVH